jgi:hypothetical protein
LTCWTSLDASWSRKPLVRWVEFEVPFVTTNPTDRKQSDSRRLAAALESHSCCGEAARDFAANPWRLTVRDSFDERLSALVDGKCATRLSHRLRARVRGYR